jgi:hypothetical protein
MPIKSKREVFCKRCGKKIIIECNDDLTIEVLKKLTDRICLKCRVNRKVSSYKIVKL